MAPGVTAYKDAGERLEAAKTQLRELAAAAAPLVPAVVQRQQTRFLERWQEALAAAQAGASIPAEALRERALGEAATFALRIDVAEELARLGSHLSEIQRLLGVEGRQQNHHPYGDVRGQQDVQQPGGQRDRWC